MRSSKFLRLLVGLAASCILATPVGAQTFLPGDVIVSGSAPGPTPLTASFKVLWFDSAGTFKGTLYHQSPATRAIETAFGPGSILHIGLEARVTRLAPNGTTSGASPTIEPRRMSIAADGRVYASHGTGDETINELNSALQLTDTFNLSPAQIEGVDLAADQCTLYYTTFFPAQIGRYNVCTNTALAPLTAPVNPDVYGVIRLLPDGLLHEGQGGIFRRNTAGSLVQTYAGYSRIALDLDRQSFWTAQGVSLYKLDIATGNVVAGPIPVLNDIVQIWSISVVGEPRAALAGAGDIPIGGPLTLLLLAAGIVAVALITLRR